MEDNINYQTILDPTAAQVLATITQTMADTTPAAAAAAPAPAVEAPAPAKNQMDEVTALLRNLTTTVSSLALRLDAVERPAAAAAAAAVPAAVAASSTPFPLTVVSLLSAPRPRAPFGGGGGGAAAAAAATPDPPAQVSADVPEASRARGAGNRRGSVRPNGQSNMLPTDIPRGNGTVAPMGWNDLNLAEEERLLACATGRIVDVLRQISLRNPSPPELLTINVPRASCRNPAAYMMHLGVIHGLILRYMRDAGLAAPDAMSNTVPANWTEFVAGVPGWPPHA